MHRDLILKAFEKAKKNEKRKGVNAPSNTSIAIVLSNFIEEKTKFPFGERSIRDYYRFAIGDESQEVNIKQQKVVIGLCKFLGHENYQEFLKGNVFEDQQKEKEDSNKILGRIKKNGINIKVIVTILSLIIFVFIILFAINQQKWMVWQDDHYEKISFNIKKYDISQLKVYKAEWVKDFKQIIPGCGVTKFFKDDGNPNLWYGKSAEGKLEYFTHYGLHPKTGKDLKPITDYMIDKYICNKESNKE